MAIANETASRYCRFLAEDCFPRLYETFIEAFSDYVFPFALTEEQFKNHIILNGVDLTRTVGCVAGDRLVGFSLNGFGEWNGKPTVYDAGTGVIPSFRRQGISDEMFEMIIPEFRSQGIKQFLLEVITENHGAVKLYEKLGFKRVRELSLLQCDKPIADARPDGSNIQLKQLDAPDWNIFSKFWIGKPSWQNSKEAIDRSSDKKRIVAAYADGECAGYVIFSSNFGRIAQMAVGKEFSRRGIGRRLAQAVQRSTVPGYSIQVINADKVIPDVNAFFESLGFYERLSQYEMMLDL
jgi:ribosomal protein S18 acetylase RimI-like enzyme